MQTMPYASAAVTREDDDVDCPPSLERLSLHLNESLLNGNLTDDAIAIQRHPDRYLVSLPAPEGVIDELPVPVRRCLVPRSRPIRICNESRDRWPVGASRLSHDDGYRDVPHRAKLRFTAQASLIRLRAPAPSGGTQADHRSEPLARGLERSPVQRESAG